MRWVIIVSALTAVACSALSQPPEEDPSLPSHQERHPSHPALIDDLYDVTNHAEAERILEISLLRRDGDPSCTLSYLTVFDARGDERQPGADDCTTMTTPIRAGALFTLEVKAKSVDLPGGYDLDVRFR